MNGHILNACQLLVRIYQAHLTTVISLNCHLHVHLSVDHFHAFERIFGHCTSDSTKELDLHGNKVGVLAQFVREFPESSWEKHDVFGGSRMVNTQSQLS